MFASPVAKSGSSKQKVSTVEAQQKKEPAEEGAQRRQWNCCSSAMAPLAFLPTPPNELQPKNSVFVALQATAISEKSRAGLASIPTFAVFEQKSQDRRNVPARPLAIQTKLCVGGVDDPLEREADRVADSIMRAPFQRLSVSNAPPQITRKWSAETARVSSAHVEAPHIVHDVLRSAGQPLDAATRAFMEPRFGQNFSNVRIHTDAMAASSADAVNARAYTAGNHLVFAAGQFAPGSAEGKTLLAHELTHVVQQNGAAAGVQRSPKEDDDKDTPSRPSDVKVTQKVEGTKIIQNERLDRGRDHALLVRIMDFTVPISPDVSERLYRGQELPSLRGNKTEISWTDVTEQAQRGGRLSVDWNMPSLDEGNPKKQLEKDREIAQQYPNPLVSLFFPVSKLNEKDRSSEIHDPMIRSQYRVDRQGIEAGTNLGRATGAVVADTAAAASLAPAIAEAGAVAGPAVASGTTTFVEGTAAVARAYPIATSTVAGLSFSAGVSEATTGKSAGFLNPARLISGDVEVGRDLSVSERAVSAFGSALDLLGILISPRAPAMPTGDTNPVVSPPVEVVPETPAVGGAAGKPVRAVSGTGTSNGTVAGQLSSVAPDGSIGPVYRKPPVQNRSFPGSVAANDNQLPTSQRQIQDVPLAATGTDAAQPAAVIDADAAPGIAGESQGAGGARMAGKPGNPKAAQGTKTVHNQETNSATSEGRSSSKRSRVEPYERRVNDQASVSKIKEVAEARKELAVQMQRRLPKGTKVSTVSIERTEAGQAQVRAVTPSDAPVGMDVELKIKLPDGTVFKPDGVQFKGAKDFLFQEHKEVMTIWENSHFSKPIARRELEVMLQERADIYLKLKDSGCLGFLFTTNDNDLADLLADIIGSMQGPGRQGLMAPGH